MRDVVIGALGALFMLMGVGILALGDVVEDQNVEIAQLKQRLADSDAKYEILLDCMITEDTRGCPGPAGLPG